jgi:hypothetical protein
MVHTRHLPRSSSRGARRNFRGYPALVPMLVLALSSAAAFRGLPAGRPGASRVAPSVRMDIYDGPSPGVETSGKAGLEDGLGKFADAAPKTEAEFAAARASQPDPSAAPAPDVMAAGRSAKTVSFCDTIRVGGKQLAGDVGFDPLAIADTPSALVWYREAEVKHARLAMLAAVGWPLSEQLNLGGLLTADGRAPSLANGGLDAVSVVYWLAALGLGVFAETRYLDTQIGVGRKTDYCPGMLGFDPLGGDSDFTRAAEIWNGRVAMVAVTIYALEEAVTKTAVVSETPWLFEPFWSWGPTVIQF